jgi:hypothetical protein
VPAATTLFDVARSALLPVRAKLVVVRSNARDLERVADWMRAGVLRAVIDSEHSLTDVRAALAEIPCFQNLEQAGATTPAADGRRQYRLEADIRCPDERRASDDNGRRRGRRSGGASSAAQGGE